MRLKPAIVGLAMFSAFLSLALGGKIAMMVLGALCLGVIILCVVFRVKGDKIGPAGLA